MSYGQTIVCTFSVIERDLRPFEKGIVKEMLPYGDRHVLYQVVDHKLYRSANCTFEPRCSGVEHFLLKIVDQLPDVEFLLNDHDYPFVSTYSKPKMTSDYLDIMYPAWSFWEGGPSIKPYPTGIGRWDLLRETLSKEAAMWPWGMKKSKGFFRGSRTNKKRDALILLSRRRPDLVRAEYTKNQAWKSSQDTLGMKAVKEVPFEYNCRFKYLFNSAGVAASFRLRHLFLCRSLVFHIGDDWQEFYYSQLKPWVHYIPVNDDLSNVEELLQFARENDELVKQIADRGYNFIWNNLRMEDVECYWKTLLTRYAALLRFNVVRNPDLVHIVGR
ncbi:protein O glucosyltransferase 1 [Trichuris trichiura]|uniref:Protein O glucosyltransferase 1 n=1 Tax=Trichuris trichiura TaxID=36087 RepID=A0A077Z689_TRITR|nr:protein O glucosyltransferase 1 [Trichuris trichiura]